MRNKIIFRRMAAVSVSFAAVLVLSFFLQQASSVSSVGPDTDWVIEGDCVRWNNTNGDIKVCPHTLTRSGWVDVELTSYLPSVQDLTFALGISEGLSVSKPQVLANTNHPYVVSNCTRVTVEVLNNGTPQNEEQMACNSYTADNYYNDWQSVGGFYRATYNGRTWYQRDASWDPGETKTVRAWVDVAPRSGRNKYHVFLKKASDTIVQAVSTGNYVLLDPWVDSPPTVFNETFDNGQFVNASLTSLNISRGYLILNASGANSTNIMLSTGSQSCWNSSSDNPTSFTEYHCSNLYDNQVANPFDVTQVWAVANSQSSVFPQYVAFELNQHYWLYNFSVLACDGCGDGRNPKNWSIQVSDTAINLSTAAGPGSDAAANWLYAQFNYSTPSGGAPDSQNFSFGPVRTKYFRWHITSNLDGSSQVYITELYAYRSVFNTSGQLTSTLLNGSITVDTVSVTCVNLTGNSNEVGMNITILDMNYANEQTVQCNSDSANGFENNINDIEGLIYRINFSSKHQGLTPELDFITFRVTYSGESVNEEGGDIAIEQAINTTLPSATKYKTQKVYVVNASNNQWRGTVDYLVVQNNPPKRWLLNYITAGESYLSASNLSNTVYVFELANKTQVQIRDAVKSLLNATKT